MPRPQGFNSSFSRSSQTLYSESELELLIHHVQARMPCLCPITALRLFLGGLVQVDLRASLPHTSLRRPQHNSNRRFSTLKANHSCTERLCSCTRSRGCCHRYIARVDKCFGRRISTESAPQAVRFRCGLVSWHQWSKK